MTQTWVIISSSNGSSPVRYRAVTNKCCYILNRIPKNKRKLNLNHNTIIFINKTRLQMSSATWWPFLLVSMWHSNMTAWTLEENYFNLCIHRNIFFLWVRHSIWICIRIENSSQIKRNQEYTIKNIVCICIIVTILIRLQCNGHLAMGNCSKRPK